VENAAREEEARQRIDEISMKHEESSRVADLLKRVLDGDVIILPSRDASSRWPVGGIPPCSPEEASMRDVFGKSRSSHAKTFALFIIGVSRARAREVIPFFLLSSSFPLSP